MLTRARDSIEARLGAIREDFEHSGPWHRTEVNGGIPPALSEPHTPEPPSPASEDDRGVPPCG